MNVRLTKEQKIKVLNSEALYKIMQQILLRQNMIRRNQEHFWVAGLNSKNTLLFVELVAIGAVNRVETNAPDLFRLAIYKLASKVIMVHNHPSGELTPSESDLRFTQKMCFAGKIIDVDVLDHLIINEEKYVSFLDEDLMPPMAEGAKYELLPTEESGMLVLLKEVEEKAARLAKKKESYEIAKRLKDMEMAPEAIQKATGLSLKEIEKIK